MKRGWIEIILNALFWLITAWFITSGFSIQAQEREIVNGAETIRTIRSETLINKLFVATGISVLLFYLNLFNILRLRQNKNRWRTAIVSAGLLMSALAVFLMIQKTSLLPYHLPLPPVITSGIFIFYFTISTAYGFGKIWIASDRQKQSLAIEKKQSELNLMRNQLQPHFLFNALNNLLSMVDQQRTPQLANSIEKLSGLLRYVIDESSAGSVSIKKEIEFIRNYAELQLLRFEEGEVNFKLDITGKNDYQKTEPGIFISFVENAFKYGTEPEKHATIEAAFDLTSPDKIIFRIKNFIFPHNEIERKGTGIAAAKRRLLVAYPDRHDLRITENDYYFLKLIINTHEGDNS